MLHVALEPTKFPANVINARVVVRVLKSIQIAPFPVLNVILVIMRHVVKVYAVHVLLEKHPIHKPLIVSIFLGAHQGAFSLIHRKFALIVWLDFIKTKQGQVIVTYALVENIHFLALPLAQTA
jgi:hypothetical protein